MSKVYIVEFDNGELYSEHSHQVIAVCSTEEKAKKKVSDIEQWVEENTVSWEQPTLPETVECPFAPVIDNYTKNSNRDMTISYYDMELDA